MGLLREQCAEFSKGLVLYCCNQVWMKNGGRFPWDVTALKFLISRLTGRHCTKGDLENLLKDQLFHVVQWLNMNLFPRKTSRESINLVGKYYLVYASDTLCTRGEFGKETFRFWTLRSWKWWTHQKSTQKDSMRKR